MYPYKIGGVITLYGICVAVGVLACFIVFWLLAKRDKLESKYVDFITINGVATAAVGFFCAALFQAIYSYIDDPSQGFDLFGNGLTFLGGFIGGDITSGLLLTGFGRSDLCELYMDLGTNCEIMLNDHGRFYALSAAAGPAFERNNLRRDHLNAIRHLEFDGTNWQFDPALSSPEGYCGTALVDLLAEGKRHRFLDKFAKWVTHPALPENLISPHSVLAELVTAKAAIEIVSPTDR